MSSGTTYAIRAMASRTSADAIATRSRRSRHHARRYGPAGFGSAGSRGRSATTAETTGARTVSGGPDLGVDEAIRHVDQEIRDDVRRRGHEDDRLDQRVVLLEDRVDREL